MSRNAVRLVSDSAMPAGVRVSQLQPVLGSIISGFRFDGRPLNNESRSVLRDLLHNRGLVIFIFPYAGPHTSRAPENPDATMSDSLEDKNLRNHIWHADGRVPSGCSSAHGNVAQLLPDLGGDAIFSNAARYSAPKDVLARIK